MSAECPEPLSENSKIEIAKALLAVKSVATEQQYTAIRSMLVDSDAQESVDRAISGLSKEAEFALMCRLMGTATHLVHLEQRPVIRGEYQVPDFLARFKPGCTSEGKKSSECSGLRCLVEVKSTTKDAYRIGGKRLRRLRAFADEFGLPLIFAVRFLRFEHAALWLMVEDADRTTNSVVVTFGALTEGGVRNVVWDEYAFFLRPGVYFRDVYDSAAGGTGATHQVYGTLQEFHIVFPDDVAVSGAHVEGNVAKYVGHDATIMSAFFEGFNPVECLAESAGTRTVVARRPGQMLCLLADLLFIFNRLPRDRHGRVLFDPSRILAGTGGDSWLATREFIERVASDLMGSALFITGLGTAEAQLQTWQRFGGRV